MEELLERLGLKALTTNPVTAALGATAALLFFSPGARRAVRRGVVATAAGALALSDAARSAGRRLQKEWSALLSEAEQERLARRSEASRQAHDASTMAPAGGEA